VFLFVSWGPSPPAACGPCLCTLPFCQGATQRHGGRLYYNYHMCMFAGWYHQHHQQHQRQTATPGAEGVGVVIGGLPQKYWREGWVGAAPVCCLLLCLFPFPPWGLQLAAAPGADQGSGR
jgi:hypothetical protein